MRTLKTNLLSLFLLSVSFFSFIFISEAYAIEGVCVPTPPCYCNAECFRCGPGGCSSGSQGSSAPSYDYEAERQKQELERQRKLKAEKQKQKELQEQLKKEEEATKQKQVEFERNKNEALQNMKGFGGEELDLKGTDSGSLGLKDIGDKGKVTAYTIGLSSARGDFSIKNSDGSTLTNANVQAGSVVRVDTGTHVTLGPTGHLRIILPDKTVFTMGPNCDMVIDEFVFDPNNSPKKIAVSVTKGSFRWITGKTANKDPASMKVTLPAMAVGIRGTDFETFIKADGSGYIKLFSGKLEITPQKTGVMFLMEGKNMVKFKSDGTFSEPEPIK